MPNETVSMTAAEIREEIKNFNVTCYLDLRDSTAMRKIALQHKEALGVAIGEAVVYGAGPNCDGVNSDLNIRAITVSGTFLLIHTQGDIRRTAKLNNGKFVWSD